MKTPLFLPVVLLLTTVLAQAQTTRVGVGTTTPRAGLDITHDDGIVATSTSNQGNTDNLPTGPGTRLMWIPKKSAFRAGVASGNQWDIDNVGDLSVSLGGGSMASGAGAVALGFGNTASGTFATALGYNTTASGSNSTALGNLVNTNNQLGSFAIGDYTTGSALNSSAENQFSARFAGGYRLFSNSGMTQGLVLSSSNRLRLGSTILAPRAGLDVAHPDGLLATGNVGGGNTDNLPTGAGTRLMWVPKNAAFRIGAAQGDEWDPANLGLYSLAAGTQVKASGDGSVALGASSTASGNYSVTLGSYANTDSKIGSFVFGDRSNTPLASALNNEFSARFAGGYRFFSNAAATQGLFLTGANRLGLGSATTAPRAGLDVAHNDGLVATGQGPDPVSNFPGPGNTADLPTGPGTRMMWIPGKSAFRAGTVNAAQWDVGSVGNHSTALGYSTTASAEGATALGYETSATSLSATALGYQTTASNRSATALGNQSSASGRFSFSAGFQTSAGGDGAVALGYSTTASANYATALGSSATASGASSVAIGSFVSTNGLEGSFVLGDRSTNQVMTSSAEDQFSARFAGGYRLYTSNSVDTGPVVTLDAGGSAWSTTSDSTKKEGFRPADGAQFLRKIAGMRLGSWNYKGQDARTMRHYGPMAQDFHAAFGRDGVGTVGTDTTINGADFDGVNLIAIKALIAEVDALKAENQRLNAENAALGRETASLRSDVDAIKRLLVANTGK